MTRCSLDWWTLNLASAPDIVSCAAQSTPTTLATNQKLLCKEAGLHCRNSLATPFIVLAMPGSVVSDDSGDVSISLSPSLHLTDSPSGCLHCRH